MKSNPRQHFPALDGIRAAAVLLVLLTHTMPAFFPWGWLGVQIFFVLSGFLITGILFDTRERPSRYRDFYVRRALRIFPLYYLVLILSVTLSRGSIHPPHLWLWFAYLQNFAWYLPYMHNFHDDGLRCGAYAFGAIGHLWSLAVEEQFYLVWPFLVFTIKSREGLMLLCGVGIAARLILGFALLAWAPQAWLHAGLLYRLLPTQMDGFLMGGLLALWMRSPGAAPHRRLQPFARWGPIAAGGYALLLFVLHLHPFPAAGDVLSYTSPFQGTVGLPLANLASVCVIAAALVPETIVYRIFSLPWLRKLGLISYGFYVLHLFVLVNVRPLLDAEIPTWRLLRSGFWYALCVFVCTSVISYASYRWFEAPFLRLKDRFAPGHRSNPAGTEVGLVS